MARAPRSAASRPPRRRGGLRPATGAGRPGHLRPGHGPGPSSRRARLRLRPGRGAARLRGRAARPALPAPLAAFGERRAGPQPGLRRHPPPVDPAPLGPRGARRAGRGAAAGADGAAVLPRSRSGSRSTVRLGMAGYDAGPERPARCTSSTASTPRRSAARSGLRRRPRSWLAGPRRGPGRPRHGRRLFHGVGDHRGQPDRRHGQAPPLRPGRPVRRERGPAGGPGPTGPPTALEGRFGFFQPACATSGGPRP